MVSSIYSESDPATNVTPGGIFGSMGGHFCFARIGLETPEMHSMDQCSHFASEIFKIGSEMAKLGEKWCDNSPQHWLW